MANKSLKIKDFFGNEVEVTPHLFLYQVTDYMGKTQTIPGINLTINTGQIEEPYATLTKSFGEFIGIKNCAYMDLNNCPFAITLLDLGIAKDTGYSKESGFCSYPLWVFKEDFFEEIGGEKYEQYSKDYEEAMHPSFDEDDDLPLIEPSM